MKNVYYFCFEIGLNPTFNASHISANEPDERMPNHSSHFANVKQR